MVGGEIFSATQGPEDLQNRSQPRQRPSFAIGLIAARQPVSDAGERLMEEGKSWLEAVQAARPATQRGGIRDTIRVLERRCRLFPGAMRRKTPPQCLTARQQTVVRVREGKQRKKGEGLSAARAATAAYADPVVMRIVCLLAAASVADDRITFTSGASSQNDSGAVRGPIRFELVWRDAKWDKQNRRIIGALLSGIDLPRSEPEAELLPPEEKISTGREYSFSATTCFRGVNSQN